MVKVGDVVRVENLEKNTEYNSLTGCVRKVIVEDDCVSKCVVKFRNGKTAIVPLTCLVVGVPELRGPGAVAKDMQAVFTFVSDPNVVSKQEADGSTTFSQRE
jgi:hypothetical protein